MYIFKYIEGQIYRNGSFYKEFADFVSDNPGFPITEGNYFEYRGNGFDVINSQGHHIATQPDIQLIQAIEAIND